MTEILVCNPTKETWISKMYASRYPPYHIAPLDGKLGTNGYARSDTRLSPHNLLWRAVQVERFRIWRQAMMRSVMRLDMSRKGQHLNGHGFAAEEVEIEKPRSLEYES